ncbi:acyl-CoA dehydrogenase family protein [Mangrovibrevibacter kandeliae]|uniref:acyl-CoA dehydrogenase family protein n=1 Tax=Mangrovibrevibacter kandeliae TaxID=2968473 RepID=UPI0021199E7C|nr:acyl-CoA dehydrogenase family protein [Aurantimonas sp. MSK8Z-1]MCQ8782512.1 acyl-CoA dehydrogenase family protein [Aurantimonas sp. CSK15Z-1]MCW4114679.1 acyl-CoA dehydrogenase family protein [Aurantimonas sp. MSK8Z-1]
MTNRTTQAVSNQSSDFSGFNAFRCDPLLRLIVQDLPAETLYGLDDQGAYVGSAEAQEVARLANTEVPRLRRFDEKGRPIDVVDYHPAYHSLMRRAAAEGLHASLWWSEGGDGEARYRARAARYYLTAGLECGHLCPMTMTSASVPALGAAPELLTQWLPLITARAYDPGTRAPLEKAAVTLGMGMTEKQGGTDVRSNTSRATAAADGLWRIDGHKWFLSAPMSDAFLVLAQTGDGPTCFLLPRRLENGLPNGLRFQRLKDKLGNRSNASAEVEFDDARGILVGESGAGIRTILQMVTLTRLDCALASAGLMRSALAEAVHHCRERRVFGKALVEQPQMTRVLADMALDVAAATALAFRLARAYDRSGSDPAEARYARAMTPVAKYWICKLAPALTYEAMECLGGNGYIEDGRLARAYREAPVNAIWEGSGNVMALDVARVASRTPELFHAVIDGIAAELGSAAHRTPDILRVAVAMAAADEGTARLMTEQLALAAAAAELSALGLGAHAAAFIETRLGGVWRHSYGMLDLRHDSRAILDDLFPPIH